MIIVDLNYLEDASEADVVVGGGWFEKATGIRTPKVLTDIDKTVREEVPGGWVGVALEVGKILL